MEFPLLEEIPEQHKSAWTLAWSKSLRRWKEASTDHDKNTALLWMGFWGQALQRKAIRGGRKGRVEVASRYTCVQEEDWGALVDRYERDTKKRTEELAKMREKREGETGEQMEQRGLTRLRREVVRLIESGQLGKAMGRVTSHGLGDTADPTVRHQLNEKFPPRSRPLPASVQLTRPIDSFRNLRESLISLNPGVAPGSGGLRNEYLSVLAERMNDEEIKLLEELSYQVGSILYGSPCRQWLHLRMRRRKQSDHWVSGTH